MIHEHFEVSFNQRFRGDAEKRRGHKDFIDKQSKDCWAFGFFIDFRGFVQHRGFGLESYSRTISATSVKISLSQDSAALAKESRDWKRSKLAGSEGELDLVSLLREFHLRMLNDYFRFIVDTFYPELVPAAELYHSLTAEATKQTPGGRMIFARDLSAQETVGDKMTMAFEHVPNDLFLEFGITAPEDTKF
jgi:hypothetical protein